MKTLKERLESVRASHRWSWADWSQAIGEKTDTTVSKNTLSAISRGEMAPTGRVMEAAAKAAGVSPGWLHYGVGDSADTRRDDPKAVVIAAMRDFGHPETLVKQLEAITGVKGDLATWMQLAIQLIEDAKAQQHLSRRTRKRRT